MSDHDANSRTASTVSSRSRATPHSSRSDSPNSDYGTTAVAEVVIEQLSAKNRNDVHPSRPFTLLPKSVDEGRAINEVTQTCRVRPAQVLDIYPCTALQAGLMASTAVEGGSYITAFEYALSNDVDLQRLHCAWNRVATQHPILRTRISNLSLAGFGDIFVQVVIDEPIDWAHVVTTDQLDTDATAANMGLGTRLIHLYCSAQKLVVQMHHALYDGWSLDLLLDQVEDVYYDRSPCPLTPMSAFIEHVQDLDIGRQNSFWRQYLEDSMPQHFPALCPTVHLAKPDQEITFLITDLPWLGRDATPATFVTAAWAMAIASETQAEDVFIGSTVTGRQASLPEIRTVAGPTIATVPRRLRVNWHETCQDFLQNTQKQMAAMVLYEQTGLANIAKLSESARNACEFQNLLVIQPAPNDDSMSSLDARVMKQVESSTSSTTSDTYAIVLEAFLGQDNVHVRMAFDSGIISKEHVEWVAHNFVSILTHIVRDTSPSTELQHVKGIPWHIGRVWDWNATVPDSVEQCFHELVTRKAQGCPLAPAVDAWDGGYTYLELDSLSDQLASYLCRFAVRGRVVPLVLKKSKWVPVAVVAVAKAGAICLLLDTALPRARLSDILSQLDVPLLLCSRDSEVLAQSLQCETVVKLDEAATWHAPDIISLPIVSSSDTLYINFTSGSTGVPKGAMISHANACSFVAHQQKILGLNEKSRILDFSSYAFDACWGNLLHSLTSGACLCVPAEEERVNDMAGCFEKYNVTVVDLTPGVARIVGQNALARLDTLILGGETVDATDAALAGQHTRVFNVYGPAECTITATIKELCDGETSIGTGKGLCTWIIDPSTGELARIGEPGELWLEGPLVGQGYLNDLERTRAVFVIDPPWLSRGIPPHSDRAAVFGRKGTCYRTGDLVRYNRDGSLEFVGRTDSQVKIRGQRVELGEIERNILKILPKNLKPTVCAEIIKPDGWDKTILAAVISAHATEGAYESIKKLIPSLRPSLEERVPLYQIPDLFVPIPDVPRTITGKIDHASLKVYANNAFTESCQNLASEATFPETSSPVSEREAVLQQVWCSVLKLPAERITVDAPFVKLGGDSITAMQVVAQAKTRNLRLKVMDILQASTIRKLAPRCMTVTGQDQSLVESIDEGAENEPFQLAPIQKLFFDDYPDGQNHWNQSFLFELRNHVDRVVLQDAVRALVERHGMLRARFHKDQNTGIWTQRIQPVLDIDTLFAFAEHVVERDDVTSITESRQKSFDLRHGPVFAVDFFQVHDGPQMILFSAHHAVVDLVSWRIIWTDVEDFVTQGSFASHPTTSFRDWCHRQRRWASFLSPLDVLPYHVTEAPDFWNLPAAANTFADCTEVVHALPESITSVLFGKSNDALRTEATDIIVAALSTSFSDVFPEREPATVWCESHGRTASAALSVDTTSTVGWFTTLYPLPVSSEAQGTIVEAIASVKDNRLRVPDAGSAYFACRYYSVSGQEMFKHHGLPEITLNFSGRFQQIDSDEGLFCRPSGGHMDGVDEVAPAATRFTMIEVNAEVDHGELIVSFGFHNRMQHLNRLVDWTSTFMETLTCATKHLETLPTTFTTMDVPLLRLSQPELFSLRASLARDEMSFDDVVEMYPCLPVQEGMLLSAEKGVASYLVSSIWKCTSATQLSAARLLSCWRQVVQRHSILQTIFRLHPNEQNFIQIVRADLPIRTRLLRIDNGDVAEVLDGLDGPHFAASEPQLQFVVCESSSGGQVACRLDIHHSLIDAASVDQLLSELARLYKGDTLPDPPSFREVVGQWAAIPTSKRVEEWARVLQTVKPCMFPVAGMRTSHVPPNQCGSISLPKSVTEGIMPFCVQHNITRAVFVQIIWSLVLRYFTGQDRVSFGYLEHGRDTDTLAVVGPLANLLIGEVDLRPSSYKVLERTAAAHLARQSLEHTSIAEISRHMGLPGALFNTTISLQQAALHSLDHGISFELHGGDDQHEYDMGIHALLESSLMEISIEYRKPLVTAQLAREAVATTIAAIRFLTMVDFTVEEPLGQAFSAHLLGRSEKLAEEFWLEHLSSSQAVHYPRYTDAGLCGCMDETTTDIGHSLLPTEWSHDTVLSASWALLATQMTGSNEAIFGFQPAMTLVPHRIEVDYASSGSAFLAHVASSSERILANAGFGFHGIQRLSSETAAACQFQVLLQSQETVSPAEAQSTSPLIVSLQTEVGRSTRLWLQFDSTAVSKDEVTRIAFRLRRILLQLIDPRNQDKTLKDMDLVIPLDLATIHEWNQTVPANLNATVLSLVDQQVATNPQKTAIHAWDGSLTYAQLDEQSNLVAYKLMAQGVGRGDYVPLLFEKSAWMPVASLAVMKTGAAAVATDPSTQPRERLEAMVRLVKAKVALCSAMYQDVGDRVVDRVVVVGPEAECSQRQTCERGTELPGVLPSDTLYVQFTSGTTGIPKAVEISHDSMATALTHQRTALNFQPDSRVLDFASYAFDVYWSNLLHVLAIGACFCIPSALERTERMDQLLGMYEISLADLNPSIARHLPSLNRLTSLTLGGEVALPDDRLLVGERGTVRNAYGPAECTPTSTIKQLTSVDSRGIGEALGVATWVVSQHDATKLAPVGAVGELWIEGPLVGKGYVHNEVQTQQAFIQDPDFLTTGTWARTGRLYRTGDLVSYTTDGELLFHGRKDTQVKLRGQRIELDEVEDAVRNAFTSPVIVIAEVITLHERQSPTLVSFVSSTRHTDDSPSALLDHERAAPFNQEMVGLTERLASVLPAYMIPSTFIPVLSIPRVPSGKINRRALRDLAISLPFHELMFDYTGAATNVKRAPTTQMQKDMAKIWSEVLGVEEESIGLDDHFFRLGGDSFAAMRVINRARERGWVKCSVPDLFQQARFEAFVACEER